jgi:hypothetical protein
MRTSRPASSPARGRLLLPEGTAYRTTGDSVKGEIVHALQWRRRQVAKVRRAIATTATTCGVSSRSKNRRESPRDGGPGCVRWGGGRGRGTVALRPSDRARRAVDRGCAVARGRAPCARLVRRTRSSSAELIEGHVIAAPGPRRGLGQWLAVRRRWACPPQVDPQCFPHEFGVSPLVAAYRLQGRRCSRAGGFAHQSAAAPTEYPPSRAGLLDRPRRTRKTPRGFQLVREPRASASGIEKSAAPSAASASASLGQSNSARTAWVARAARESVELALM